MKKILVWLLVVTLTATAAIGGTLAYFTDRDSEANVFTVGNVEIDLEEDFDQGATLIPGVNIEKKPTITNTGANDAWVWAEIAIPSELNSTASAAKNIIHFNMSKESVAENLWNWWDGADYSEGAYMITEKEIDGVTYDVYTVQYETALKAGETTAEPVIYKVFLDPHVDIDPDGNWAWVEDGQVTSINWNSETNGNPVIYVSAYAMQTEGFDTVYAAYDAYQTQWGDNGGEYAEPIPADVTLVTNAEELIAALDADKAVMLANDITLAAPLTVEKTVNIDLNGKSLGTVGLELKNGGSIKNGDIKSSGNTNDFLLHLLVSGGTMTMDDVTINVTDSMYAGTGYNCSSQACGLRVENAKVVLNNCDVKVYNDTNKVYFVQAWAIDILDAEVIMNGGSITAKCEKGTAEDQSGLDDPAFACAISADGVSTMTLNNVTVTAPYFGEVFDWQDYSSQFTFNTTDANVTEDDFILWWSAKLDVNHIS